MFIRDKKKLISTINKLKETKKNSRYILNSDKQINSWLNYFFNIDKDPKFRCVVSLHGIYISANGDVKLCDYTDRTIGNISRQKIKIILDNKDFQKEQRRLFRCKKQCSYCVQRNFLDFINIFRQYTK